MIGDLGTPVAGPQVLDQAGADDLEALIAIDASGHHWTREAFSSELGKVPPTLYCLRGGESGVLAFAVVRVAGPDLDIVNFAVALGHRRSGLGRRLLRLLLDEAASRGVTSAFLEARASNQAALALYASVGFKETQRRRNFYASPTEDGVLMSCILESQQGLNDARTAC